jgi:hypothetical protein
MHSNFTLDSHLLLNNLFYNQCCGSTSFDADPDADPTFDFDTDPDPDPDLDPSPSFRHIGVKDF